MPNPILYIGMHRVSKAHLLPRAMLSYNILEERRSDFSVNEWILDSGAFTRIVGGKGHVPVRVYANAIRRWRSCGRMVAAVQQDYMCEPIALAATGMTVDEHQNRTTRNYLTLRDMIADDAYVMPVIQGFEESEYRQHVESLSPHLALRQWVGVGSVCKRQGVAEQLARVLSAIRGVRPDLRLHGFGVKATALRRADISEWLHSVDSMAWSFAARREGRDSNSPDEALAWAQRTERMRPEPTQDLLEIW